MKTRPTFSHEERGLLDAIYDDPRDEMRYLVYADWLEERGDPLAEFIRLDCRNEWHYPMDSNPFEPGTDAYHWRNRRHQLLAAHGNFWKRPLPGWVRHCHFRRGLPHGSVEWPFAGGLPLGFLQSCRDMNPRTSLRVKSHGCSSGELGLLARSPIWRRVSDLWLYVRRVEDQIGMISTLASLPRLDKLDSIDLSGLTPAAREIAERELEPLASIRIVPDYLHEATP